MKDAAKNEIASFTAKSAKLKADGDAKFAQRKMREALASYEKALNMCPGGTEERAAIHSNRAACYLMENQYQMATREASAALESTPGFKPALVAARALSSASVSTTKPRRTTRRRQGGRGRVHA